MKLLVEETKLVGSPEDAFTLLHDDPYPFWLDSSLISATMGRWSFMGSSPFLTFKSWGRKVQYEEHGQVVVKTANPLAELRSLLQRFALPRTQHTIPFTGGAVGFFSYDLGRMIESLPQKAQNDLQTPDIYLAFYNTVLAVDHVENKAYIVAQSERELSQLKERLSAVRPGTHDPWAGPKLSPADVKAHFSCDSYSRAVDAIKEYIVQGDVYQVNMTQRLQAPLRLPPFELYRRLRRANPAPFAAYLDCGQGLRVLSSSPERFLAVQNRLVETRPIKGTRPRGRTPAEDEANAKALLGSVKDRAELVMIIDLMRNDLGRVCAYGSVHVPELIVLEKYAQVFHLVSTVRGELAPTKDFVDLLKATFPGGSITGAPKIRAMEIIEELEPVRRGIYTGAIGYIGFDGCADLNIAIRTFVNQCDRLYLQVGGAVVYDSVPKLEYEETLHKAKAMLMSLGVQSDD
ncbi:MAG: Aminodeoxychorismate synthase component 1 [Firmicutes bacterium]|nr:Aminodeoxychorismate synthase component 1 [candidate division NPL-UPA2 bacterium]